MNKHTYVHKYVIRIFITIISVFFPFPRSDITDEQKYFSFWSQKKILKESCSSKYFLVK